MKNIVLMPNDKKDSGLELTKKVIDILNRHSANIYLDSSYEEKTGASSVSYVKLDCIDFDVDAIIVIGGDGSILDAATVSLKHDAPILGINLGRVGYLSEIDVDKLQDIDRLFTGEYKITEHMTLDVIIEKDGKRILTERKAVNDVVVSHEESFGISDLELSDGLGNVLSYRADGLILSTPIGSTAYSLSAGGPVIDSSLQAICVTPICTHSFFNRSVLFSPSLNVSVKHISSNDDKLCVNIDGRDTYFLSQGDSVTVTKSPVPFKTIVLGNPGMLGVIYKKMKYNFDFGR